MRAANFTWALAQLLVMMNARGNGPVVQYVFRSTEEQQRLFKKGLTKCDGVKKKSKHQLMLAADIYLTKGEKILWEWDKADAEYWHEEWERLGGRPMISWDCGHFEF